MKQFTHTVCIILIIVILVSSCSSTTMIVSNPPNAKVYLDGAFVGETPYRLMDSKIVGSNTSVKIEKDGYKNFIASITKDEDINVGAVIGGLFVLVPFLWTMQYNPVHTYNLQPLIIEKTNESVENTEKSNNSKSKVSKLREIKQLLDEKIITQSEFDKEKAKILDEKE